MMFIHNNYNNNNSNTNINNTIIVNIFIRHDKYETIRTRYTNI